MSTTFVVVPCFNEERRLATADFVTFARESGVHLLFVDDGSRDGTRAVLDAMVDVSPESIHALRLQRNHGKGAAVRAGLREAIRRGAEVVAYLDADLSTPLGELDRLLVAREESGAAAVLGSRVGLLGHDVRRSIRRHYLGRVFATAASVVLGMQIYDTQCGAKVFEVRPALEQALASPFRTRWVFDVELLARLRALDPKMRFLEVPLFEWTDVHGSKLTVWHMLLAARDLLFLARHRTFTQETVAFPDRITPGARVG
jgi:glycosyltransferase involved in cell wall biosynthesis